MNVVLDTAIAWGTVRIIYDMVRYINSLRQKLQRVPLKHQPNIKCVYLAFVS
jgi:hypothetical protein